MMTEPKPLTREDLVDVVGANSDEDMVYISDVLSAVEYLKRKFRHGIPEKIEWSLTDIDNAIDEAFQLKEGK